MAIFIERRHLERIKIPAAEVCYRQEAGFRNCEAFEAKGEMIDLTVRGVRFKGDQKLCPGARIYVEIHVPDREEIALKGNVLWVGQILDQDPYFAVVEFLDYADEPGYNSRQSLQQLEELLNKYIVQK
mgnify:CR=1 FL=1